MYDAYLFNNIFSYQYLFEFQKNVQSNIWIVVFILNIFHSVSFFRYQKVRLQQKVLMVPQR